MKIYTKTGDSGTTGLFAGPRVVKSHPRIHAYGTVDELNAILGVVATVLASRSAEPGDSPPPSPIGKSETNTRQAASEGDSAGISPAALVVLLQSVQNDLFSVGAELATPKPAAHGMCLLNQERIAALECWIDQADDGLPELKSFILPGGTSLSAHLHLARAVCRRAERDVVELSQHEDVEDCSRVIIYLNRLSDLLFVLARLANAWEGLADVAWKRPE